MWVSVLKHPKEVFEEHHLAADDGGGAAVVFGGGVIDEVEKERMRSEVFADEITAAGFSDVDCVEVGRDVIVGVEGAPRVIIL